MASVQDLNEDIATLSESIDTLSTGMGEVLAKVGDLKGQIVAFQAQIAAGSPVTQEDLDAVDATVKAIQEVAAQVHAKED